MPKTVAPLNANALKIIGVADPTVAQDAATKAYVDGRTTTRPWKWWYSSVTTPDLGDVPSPVNGDLFFYQWPSADLFQYQGGSWVYLGDLRAQEENEGVADFAALGTDYTIPNASWGAPGWYTPMLVGPGQTWDITVCAGIRCVTSAHPISHRIAFRDSVGSVLAVGYIQLTPLTVMQPPAITTNFTDICHGRLFVPGGTPINTQIRILQEFNGTGANGRLIRDGNYYWVQARRRA